MTKKWICFSCRKHFIKDEMVMLDWQLYECEGCYKRSWLIKNVITIQIEDEKELNSSKSSNSL